MIDDLTFTLLIFLVGVVVFLLYIRVRKEDRILDMIISILTDKYLDERTFKPEDVAKELHIDEDILNKYLKKLERKGIVAYIANKGYVLVDPLVFLTPKGLERAMRITKDDNILYGAYQSPYMSSPFYFVGQFLIVLITIIFGLLTHFNMFGLRDFVGKYIPPDVGIDIFLLFLIGISIIVADLYNNLIKGLTREKYSVVVGLYSGISYDVSLTDELSGRIPRGRISKIDLEFNWTQKLNNFFGTIPVGDVLVYERGKENPVRFRSVPFPRELFYIIRSIQLGALQWRKRYARQLALWRAGAIPIFGYPSKGGRRR